jgi:hypothetical protein
VNRFGLVGKHDQADLILGPHGVDEFAGGLLCASGTLLHAAAGIQRQHEGDRLHRFLKDIDLLTHAAFEHLDVFSGERGGYLACTHAGELDRRTHRGRNRRGIPLSRYGRGTSRWPP